MSLSKPAPTSEDQESRVPKCSRCRHHGMIIPLKGHKKLCQFLQCSCWKCCLITQRTRIATFQRDQKGDAPGKTRTEEQPPGDPTRVPPDEGTPGDLVQDKGANPSTTSGLISSQSEDTQVISDVTSTSGSPLDLRSPAAGRSQVSGLEIEEKPPLTSGEEAPCSTFNADDTRQIPPFPVFHFPLRTSGLYLSLDMLLMPPVPFGFYNCGLTGRHMFSHFHQNMGHYPPPPLPGPLAGHRAVFFVPQPPPFPESQQEELQPLTLNEPEPGILEVD